MFLGAFLFLGCGASAPPTSSSADAVSSMNLPDSVWERFDVPEGGISLEGPGPAARQVSTRDDGRTYEYLVEREPLGVVIAVEHFEGIVTGDRIPVALDAVAAEFARRTGETSRACTPRPIAAVTIAGLEGREIAAGDCTAMGNGAMVTFAFIHGSALVSAIVAGQGVDLDTVRVVAQRVRQSVVLGTTPSWFTPVDQEVTVANVPGLTFRMPASPRTELTERDTGSTARITSEPIRGMAVVANVTVPAALPATGYCSALETNGNMEMVERSDHPSPDGSGFYCEVRGHRIGQTDLYEIHQVQVFGGIVFEIAWAGPFSPAFIPGGEAQLRDVVSSLRLAP